MSPLYGNLAKRAGVTLQCMTCGAEKKSQVSLFPSLSEEKQKLWSTWSQSEAAERWWVRTQHCDLLSWRWSTPQCRVCAHSSGMSAFISLVTPSAVPLHPPVAVHQRKQGLFFFLRKIYFISPFELQNCCKSPFNEAKLEMSYWETKRISVCLRRWKKVGLGRMGLHGIHFQRVSSLHHQKLCHETPKHQS